MEGCKCKPAKSYAERIIEYREFVSLVKRMREAQDEEACLDRHLFDIELYRLRVRLEREVDEYLKKMEI